MNDENGFAFYKGEYHLFYRYNPYDSVGEPMYYAHIRDIQIAKEKKCIVSFDPNVNIKIDKGVNIEITPYFLRIITNY